MRSVFYIFILLTLLPWKTKSQVTCEPGIHSHMAPFIENKGQWDDNVKFRSDFAGGRLFMHKDRFRFGFLNNIVSPFL